MTPFSICCTTCGVGLRVRKAEIVGQIIACPKCQSMVKVQPPDPSTAHSDGVDPTPPQPVHQQSGQTYDRVEQALEEPAEPLHRRDSRWKEEPQPGLDDTTSPMESTTPPDWASSRVLWARRVGGYVVTALLGGGIALGAVGLTRKHQAKQRAQQADALMESTTTTETEAATEPEAEAEAALANIGTTSEETSAAWTELAGSEPSQLSVDTPTTETTLDASATSTSTPVEVSKIVVPEVAGDSAENAERVTNRFPTTQPAHRPVDHFADLDLIDTSVHADTLAELQHTELPEGLQSGSSYHDAGRPPIPPVDVESRLQFGVSGLRFNADLGDFVNFLSNLSAVPITIRPLGIRDERLTLAANVRLAGTDTNVSELLTSALTPHRLGYRIEPGHIVIDSRAHLNRSLQLFKHDASDLLATDFTPAELLNFVRTLIEPGGWSDNRDLPETPQIEVREGYVVLRHTQAAHFNASILLEKLRASRGLPLTGVVSSSLAEFNWRRAEAEGLRPVSLPRRRQWTLGDIILALQKELAGDVQFFPDWQALAQLGWAADSPLDAPEPAETLGMVLDNLTDQCHLSVVQPAPGMVLLTSAEGAEKICEHAPHPIDDLVTDTEMATTVVEQLKLALGPKQFSDKGGEGAFWYDASTGNLWAHLPARQQKAVDWLLRQLRR